MPTISRGRAIVWFAFAAVLVQISRIVVVSQPFRAISESGLGHCERSSGIAGPEDFAFSRHFQLLFVSTDFRPNDNVLGTDNGAIVGVVPGSGSFKPVLEKPSFDFHPHGIGLWEDDSGTFLFVVNHAHAGSRIEKFRFDGRKLIHEKTYQDEFILNPNDILPVGQDRFYVSNDYGSRSKWLKKMEDILLVGRGFITYFDGASYRRVAENIGYANGIARSTDHRHLFVSATMERKIRVYRLEPSGDLVEINRLSLDFAPDNLEVSDDDRLFATGTIRLFDLALLVHDHTYPAGAEAVAISDPAGNAKAEKIYEGNGRAFSGASVAFPLGHSFYLGSVFADHFLLCARGP